MHARTLVAHGMVRDVTHKQATIVEICKT